MGNDGGAPGGTSLKIPARRISGGKARGEVLLSRRPISFLGGVDRDTGRIVDGTSDVAGEELAGRIFAFPHGKGSTVGSYIIYGLVKLGKGPRAIINSRTETIVATGAIMSDLPLVDGVDLDLLRSSESVTVDGDGSSIDLHAVQSIRHVVTSFLENGGDILILKRSERVGSFQGHWAGVSGYIESGDTPKERALIEILEETGVKAPKLLSEGNPVYARGENDPSIIWVVHPFLWHVDDRVVRLDWEHEESRWIDPVRLGDFETVPNLAKALASVRRKG